MQLAFRALLTGSVAVAALVAAPRIVWGPIGQGAALPAVAPHLIGNAPGLHLPGPDGFWQGRVQVGCFGATYAEAKGVSDAICAVLHGHKGGGFHLIAAKRAYDKFEGGAVDRPRCLSQELLTIRVG